MSTKNTVFSLSNGYNQADKVLNVDDPVDFESSLVLEEQIDLQELAREVTGDPSYSIERHFFLQHHFKGKSYLWGNRARIDEENLYIYDFLECTLSIHNNKLPGGHHVSWGVVTDDNERYIYLGLGHELVPDPNNPPLGTIYNQVNTLYKFDTVNLTYTPLCTINIAESPHLASAIYHKGYIYVACSFENATVGGLPDSGGKDSRIYKINCVTGDYTRINCPYTDPVWGKPRMYVDPFSNYLRITDGYLGLRITSPTFFGNSTYNGTTNTGFKRVVVFDLNSDTFIAENVYTNSSHPNLTDPCMVRLANRNVVFGGTPFMKNFYQESPVVFKQHLFLLPPSLPDEPQRVPPFNDEGNFSEVEDLKTGENVWGFNESFDTDVGLSFNNIKPFLGAGNVASFWFDRIAISSRCDFAEVPETYGVNTVIYDGESYINNNVALNREPPTITFLKLQNKKNRSITAYGDWIELPDIPENKSGAVSFTLNGKIYIAGGYDGSAYTNKTYEYNPDTNSWTTMADIPDDHYLGSALSHNGKGYVFGGYNRPNSQYKLVEFTPPSVGNPLGSWQLVGTIPSLYHNPQGDVRPTSFSYYDGSLYMGYSFGAFGGLYFRLIRYELSSGIWTSLSIPGPNHFNYFNISGYQDSIIYYFRGIASTFSGRSSYLDISDPNNVIASGVSELNNFFESIAGPASLTFKGKIFMAGGYTSNPPESWFYYYNIEEDAWYAVTNQNGTYLPLPSPSRFGTMTTFNNAIYLALGSLGILGSSSTNKFYKVQFI